MNHSSPSVNNLLSNIKSTVELLVQFRGDSVTSKYGAMERLRLAILPVLAHGLKQITGDIYEQLWQLIVRLNANSQKYIHLLQDIYHKENIRMSVEQWIDQSVISQCLSQQLSCAIRDTDLLSHYYSGHAFMRMPAYFRAFLICLQTVEQSDPSLLVDIDPKLSIAGFQPTTTSTEDVIYRSNTSSLSSTLHPNRASVTSQITTADDTHRKLNPVTQQRILHRRIHSDPIFYLTNNNTPVIRPRVASPLQLIKIEHDNHIENNVPSVSYSLADDNGSYASSYDSRTDGVIDTNNRIINRNQPQERMSLGMSTSQNHRESISSQITLVDEQQDESICDNRLSSIGNNNNEILLSMGSTSPMEQSIIMSTNNDQRPRTSRLPHSSLFWPRKGQTLDNYIRECDSKTRTDVEKENAHFYFSEALISAIEQIKFTQQCTKHFVQPWSSSIAGMFSSCETTHTTSSNSSSSPPSQQQQYIPCNSRLLSATSNRERTSTMELSSSSQFDPSTEIETIEPPNNFDWSVQSSTSTLDDSSAEAIALALMETWKNYKIPSAPELFWMIRPDEDLPQEPLPFPDGISIDPSEDYLLMDGGRRVLCRGNNQWAPPREQLIFHIHHSVNRDSQLKKQSYLCAGCGRHVEKGFAHRYRYCEYTGKYFCRSCHSDKKWLLPSYIINKWDFSTKHSISNFAFDYLNRIYSEPNFNLYDLNSTLFKKNKQLRMVNELRWSLYFLRYFILTCRFAEEQGLQQGLKTLHSYMYETPHIYSTYDLCQTKAGTLVKVLEPLATTLRDHVLSCPLCSAKGFICEICKNDKDVIFPFNMRTTKVCPVCQSCFHSQCFQKKEQCAKCQRTKHRNSLSSTSASTRSSTTMNANEQDDIIT